MSTVEPTQTLRLTSGGVSLRVYYNRARDGELYERYHEVFSPEDAFAKVADTNTFCPIKRINRVIMWASWYSYRSRMWTGTSEAFAIGPFSTLDDLDQIIGSLWLKTVEKAAVADAKISPLYESGDIRFEVPDPRRREDDGKAGNGIRPRVHRSG